MAIEPPVTYAETVTKFKGKARRSTLQRESYAECQDCDTAWAGSESMGASGAHAIGHMHTVLQHYEATYMIEPNATPAPERTQASVPDIAKRGRAALAKVRPSPNKRSNVTSNNPE